MRVWLVEWLRRRLDGTWVGLKIWPVWIESGGQFRRVVRKDGCTYTVDKPFEPAVSAAEPVTLRGPTP